MIVVRAAQTCMGPSVIRVFAKGTNEKLRLCLVDVEIYSLRRISDQTSYRRWFDAALDRLVKATEPDNRSNTRVQPGLRWGHCTKILCLFARDIVLHTRLFDDDLVSRLQPFLFVPIDSVVIEALRAVGLRVPARKIKHIDSAEKFFAFQTLIDSVIPKGTPRVWFDDVWAQRFDGRV